MEEIQMDQVTQENIKYLEYLSKNDFYQNDREFIKIIKKLTEQSASIGNKALTLVSLLDEAERIKFEMVQKEIALGLSQQDLPYGSKTLSDISNQVMTHRNTTSTKQTIKRFTDLLENYLSLEEPSVKKNTLLEAHDLLTHLGTLKIDPKHLIINRNRAKVWHLLEHSFQKTLKQLDIDFFIEKIRLTRIQHQGVVDEVREHNEAKSQAIFRISKAIKQNDINEINKQDNILKRALGTNIEPLLIDTQKIVDALDFMLEEIPEALTPQQTAELKQFMPALSEFYLDQCYALSGGNSYTTLAKNLRFMQKLIKEHAPIGDLLENVSTLDMTMQHLYILHWIAESILKDILNAEDRAMMGKLISQYNKKNPKTKSSIESIREAVNIRNDIAHNAMIWDPQKLVLAIETYKNYIEIVIEEQRINVNTYVIHKMNREWTQEQILSKTDEYVRQTFKITLREIEELDNALAANVAKVLHKNSFTLEKADQTSLSRKIQSLKKENDYKKRDEFAERFFNMSYLEVRNKLIQYQKDRNSDFDEKNEEHMKKAIGGLTWLYYNQESSDAYRTIKFIQERI